MKELEKFSFGDVKVEVVGLQGRPMFELYSTGMALGQTKKSKGRLYPHKERIDNNLRNAGITPVVHNVQQYISEEQLYDLMLEMKTDKVKPFRKWVTSEVLPQIRKTGGYIPVSSTDNDSEIMARAVLIADKTIKEKDGIIETLKPKAEAYDLFLNTKDHLSLNCVAKSLKIGRNKMMSLLRTRKVLFKDGYDNIPYQRYINSGYFAVNHVVGRDGNIHSTTRVSPKGVEYLHKALQSATPNWEA